MDVRKISCAVLIAVAACMSAAMAQAPADAPAQGPEASAPGSSMAPGIAETLPVIGWSLVVSSLVSFLPYYWH